jgi:hypothetical protein
MSLFPLPGDGTLVEQLKAYSAFMRKYGVNAWLLPELIARKGVPFVRAACPQSIKLGIPNKCFLNAVVLAQRHGYDYVEGVCVRKDIGVAVHHAWCAEPDSQNVIDNTLRVPADSYLGIRFLRERLYGLLGDSKYFGFLAEPNQTSYALELSLDPTLRELL